MSLVDVVHASTALVELVEWAVEKHPSESHRIFDKSARRAFDYELGGGLVSIVPLEERGPLASLLVATLLQERN